jgi:long-chain acyl-CoA synthetase
MGAFSYPGAWMNGTTGPLETCVEAKLVDIPDLGYFTNRTPPQGELWLRGPCISSGYLNREEETAKVFDKDGWLKTGDVGEFTLNGMLKIIDRVKNMAKTLKGEYIALEKVDYRKIWLTSARSYIS